MLSSAEAAAEELEAEGIDATVWDVRVVSPPDPAMLADALDHRIVVSAEDGMRHGGAGMFLADALQRRRGHSIGGAGLAGSARGVGSVPPIICLGTPRSYIAQGKPDQILAHLGLDGPGIARTVREALAAVDGKRHGVGPGQASPSLPATAVTNDALD